MNLSSQTNNLPFVYQLESWSQIDAKIVLVTSASSGLRREFCLDLTGAGCRIVAVAFRTNRLEFFCYQINYEGGLIDRTSHICVKEYRTRDDRRRPYYRGRRWESLKRIRACRCFDQQCRCKRSEFLNASYKLLHFIKYHFALTCESSYFGRYGKV